MRWCWLFLAVCVLLTNPSKAFAHAPHDVVEAIALSPSFFKDGIVFVIIRHCLLQSRNGGFTWFRSTAGLGRHLFTDLAISSAVASSWRVFAASAGGGVFRSDDSGASWKCKNHGLVDQKIAFLKICPTSGSDERLLAVSTGGDVFVTRDSGDHWNCVLQNADVSTALILEDVIYAGTRDGAILVSEDLGTSWREALRLKSRQPVTSFLRLQSKLYCGTERGVICIDPTGQNSSPPSRMLPSHHVTSLATASDEEGNVKLFAVTWRKGVFISEDLGESWVQCDEGLTTNQQADEPRFRRPHFRGIAVSPGYSLDNTVFVGGFDGLFKSTDGGKHWRELSDAFSIGLIVGLDLASESDGLRVAISTYVAGVYTRKPNGQWEVNNTDRQDERLAAIAFSPNFASDQTMFVISNWALFKSIDGGGHWEGHSLVAPPRSVLGLLSGVYSTARRIMRPLRDKSKFGRLVFQCAKQVFKSRSRTAAETSAAGGVPIPGWGALIAFSTSFETDRTLFVGGTMGILRSQDEGRSFSFVLGPSTKKCVHGLAVSPDYANDKTLFAVVSDQCLYRTVDGGRTWTELGRGFELGRLVISPGFKDDGTIYMGTTDGLMRSLDRGDHWVKIPIGDLKSSCIVDGLAISPCFATDNQLAVNVAGEGLFMSWDRGESFEAAAVDPRDEFSHMQLFPDRTSLIRFSPNYRNDQTLYASSMQRLFTSTDGGRRWSVVGYPIRFENSRSEIVYRGKWRTIRDRNLSSMNASWSSRPGDTAVFNFVGSELRWIGMRGPDQGKANVLIDGRVVGSVDQYAETKEFSVMSFVSSDLTHGPHSVVIEVGGNLNDPASHRRVVIDAFDVS